MAHSLKARSAKTTKNLLLRHAHLDTDCQKHTVGTRSGNPCYDKLGGLKQQTCILLFLRDSGLTEWNLLGDSLSFSPLASAPSRSSSACDYGIPVSVSIFSGFLFSLCLQLLLSPIQGSFLLLETTQDDVESFHPETPNFIPFCCSLLVRTSSSFCQSPLCPKQLFVYFYAVYTYTTFVPI